MKSILYSSHCDNLFQFNTICKEQGFTDFVEFTAYEDILGIPIVFLINNTGIYISADGESLITKDDKNYKLYSEILGFYDEHLIYTYKICKDFLDNAESIEYNEDKFQVNVYAKIYGGIYDHPDVPKIEGAIPLHAGKTEYPEYIPMNDLMVFDIEVNNSFLNFDVATQICNEVGLDAGYEIHRGLLNSFVNKLELGLTNIPQRFGLPSIENNEMYGIILRPIQTLEYNGERLFLKKENKDYE